jgi:hypothetical protein
VVERRFREPTWQDWLRMAALLGGVVAALVASRWIVGDGDDVLWLLAAVASLLALARWHAAMAGYRCPRCGEEFAVGFWADLLSPQMLSWRGGRKFLRCPRCRQRGWAASLVRQSSLRGRL